MMGRRIFDVHVEQRLHARANFAIVFADAALGDRGCELFFITAISLTRSARGPESRTRRPQL